MKHVLVLLLFLIALSGLSAQTHNSIPVSETYLYDFLEMAEIRGLLRPLPSARPYSNSLIASVLLDIQNRRSQLGPSEQAVLDDLVVRFVEDPDLPFSQDGDIRIEDDTFPTKFGAYLGGTLSSNMNDFTGSLGGEAYVGGYVRGDLGQHFSWGIDIKAGAFLVDDYDTTADYGPTGFEPYKYTKHWDGGVHPINELSKYRLMPTSPAFGYSYEPEIAASFWDNRLDMRFGRMRRDWGIGEGSLFLDSQARPFMGFDGTFKPWNWFSMSYLAGVLEYGETYRNLDDQNIKYTSREQQNMFAMLQMEFNPAKWLYFSIFDAAIYLKRPEWGYTFPLMSQFISQNNTGDYDNLLMGGTLSFSYPGYFRTYFSAYLDEARFHQPNFFSNPANMYSFQAGIKAPIPGLPWSLLTLQYTKIEPFTYTHYALASTPWYTPSDSDGDGHPDYAMNTGYLNNGESLGYGLEPNSDEVMLQLKSQFRRGVHWMTRYRMVRHGYAGAGGPPGSTFDAWGFDPDGSIDPNTDPDGAYYPGGTKDFLKDGIYEWFHILTLGGALDMRIWDEPVQFALEYSFVFLYYTDYSTNSNMKPLDSGIFENQYRNLVSLSFRVSPY